MARMRHSDEEALKILREIEVHQHDGSACPRGPGYNLCFHAPGRHPPNANAVSTGTITIAQMARGDLAPI